MTGPAAAVAPLSHRAGLGFWSYRLPEHLTDVESGEMLAVPFSGRGAIAALAVSTGPESETGNHELKPALGKFGTAVPGYSPGELLLDLYRRLGQHPGEAARWLGFSGTAPLFREFFFAPNRVSCLTRWTGAGASAPTSCAA